MSGGMRQRVMIAMALACNPSVLIADEPTTALDVTIQAQILDLLRELRSERGGMAILLITHNMGVVAEMAEKSRSCMPGRWSRPGILDIFRIPVHLCARLPGLGADASYAPYRRPRREPLPAIPVRNVPNPLDRPPAAPASMQQRNFGLLDGMPALAEIKPGTARGDPMEGL